MESEPGSSVKFQSFPLPVQSVSTVDLSTVPLSGSVDSRQSPPAVAVAPVVTPAAPSFSTLSLAGQGELADLSVNENENQECCDLAPDASTVVDISEAGDTCVDHNDINHLRSACPSSTSNQHSMVTGSKAGIFKPKAYHL
ncbi:hypothetical protein V6N11_039321 [Hibiscus sabdariffa]|uniref:Uncharacterized protein n=1 Tax=Hibiscus sabdariffa TaxID=183260 RepID=A0ABR2SNH0_9ROSI